MNEELNETNQGQQSPGLRDVRPLDPALQLSVALSAGDGHNLAVDVELSAFGFGLRAGAGLTNGARQLMVWGWAKQEVWLGA